MDWPSTTIGRLCDSGAVRLQTGPFGSQLHSYDYVEAGIPVVPTEAIRNRRINHSVCPQISDAKAEELGRHRLRAGDILFARRGVQATGHIGVVRDAEVGFVCGTGAILLRTDLRSGQINWEFLSHLLADPASISWFKFHAIGATMPNLNEGIIRSFPLRLPPVVHQRRIAELLSALDDKIELNRRMNDTLEAMARAIFNEWFVDFGPTRAKMEGRAPYLAPDIWALYPDRLDDEGKPKGWSSGRLSNVLELAYGKSLPARDRVDGDVPVYGSGGLSGWHDRALVDHPTIIVGRKGTVGSIYWEPRPSFPIDTVFFVRSVLPMVYCLHLLGSLGLETMNTDAAVPGLNRENAYRLDVLYDASVASAFASIVGPMRERMDANARENETLAATRDFLLPKLISGEILIRDAENLIADAA